MMLVPIANRYISQHITLILMNMRHDLPSLYLGEGIFHPAGYTCNPSCGASDFDAGAKERAIDISMRNVLLFSCT